VTTTTARHGWVLPVDTEQADPAVYNTVFSSIDGKLPEDTGHDAFYYSTVTQNIGSLAEVLVAFPSSSRTTTLVTRTASGTGHYFTLNRAGIWALTSTLRYQSHANATNERYVAIQQGTGPGAPPLAADSGSVGGYNTLNCATTRYFAAGTNICVEAYHTIPSVTLVLDNASPGWYNIGLVWLWG